MDTFKAHAEIYYASFTNEVRTYVNGSESVSMSKKDADMRIMDVN